jgi:hypothetical protein
MTAAPGPTLAAPVAANPLRALQRNAAERYATIDSYIARLKRREQLNGKDQPEEIVLFKFRKEPWSVHFKWIGPEGAGREVIYVKGQYEGKIHTLLAAGDMPFAPAGKRMALSPDSVLIKSASRHPITDAGIGHILEHYTDVLEANERADRRLGVLTYLGPQRRNEYPVALEAAELTIPGNVDPALPSGGRRLFFFDSACKLPVLLITYDHRNREAEYYCYDQLMFPVKLDNDDFNPDKLWGDRSRPRGK